MVLTAAMVGPMVGSAALRVGAGDSRVACIETRATALHLAVLAARPQLPDRRMLDKDDKPDLGRNRCSQRRWSGLRSAQLHGESAPAIAERPASKP